MFRLNDAVRRYRAQHRSPTELRCVAATATALSPPAKRDTAGVVARVDAVASKKLSPSISLSSSNSYKMKGLCCNTVKMPFSSAQHIGGSWRASASTGKLRYCTYKPTINLKTLALVGRRDGRNFGYDRQLSYAGRQALKDLVASGPFATVEAHSDHWQAFVRWCRSDTGPGYNDARRIDQQTLRDYVVHLR